MEVTVRSLQLGLPDRHELSWWEESSDPRHYDPPPVVRVDNTSYLNTVLGSGEVHYISRTGIVTVEGRGYVAPNASLLVQTAHMCFDSHVGIRLSPVVFMDIIVRELAVVIRANPSRYAHLFTRKPDEKPIIRIREDALMNDPTAWKDALEAFYLPLREAITDATFDLFAPRFSTLTEEDGIAQLVALMDAASPYYDYRVFTKCGIPLFELDGEPADWRLLVDHVDEIARLFPELNDYFDELIPVLTEVERTARSGHFNAEFWRSFYKFKSNSGMDFADGWVNTLFAHVYTADGPQRKQGKDMDWQRSTRNNYGGFKVNQFPSGISAVPFTWELMDREIPMRFVAGAIGIDQTLTKTLEARLGFAVVSA
jgi:hypothetical protein